MSLWALVIVVVVSSGVGCMPTPGDMRGETVPELMLQIVGDWEKATGSNCSEKYPDRIQFQEGGLYFAQNDPPGRFTIWDVGTYEVVGQKAIKISLANDAIIPYEFSVSVELLTFRDSDGCEFEYRKKR
jgi:hypothetical protein